MLTRNGRHYCPAGEMEFSEFLDTPLTALVAEAPHQPRVGPRYDSTSWFCPRCSQRLVTADRVGLEVYCEHCGLQLTRRMVVDLMEVHPHRNKRGEWG